MDAINLPCETARRASLQRAITLTVLSFLSLATNSYATTWIVPDQKPTMREAIAYAGEGDTVLVLPGNYTGPDNRSLSIYQSNLVLIGQAGPESTLVDCGAADRWLDLSNDSSSVSVGGFTIRNGSRYYGGAIYITGGSPVLHDLRIENSSGMSGNGGAIFIFTSSSPVLERCVITGCSAGSGGGIAVSGGAPLFFAVEINSCSSGYGGGIFVSDGHLVLDKCLIMSNGAEVYGGGVYVQLGGDGLEIRNSVISNNSAGEGGGIYAWNLPYLVLDTEIQGNVAINAAGGVGGTGGFQLVRCTITGNEAGSGGGGVWGAYWGGAAGGGSVLESVVRGNHAADGGGIYNCYVADSKILENSASSVAGALYNCTAERCIIAGNSAGYGGAAAIGEWGSAAGEGLIQCVLTGNIATHGGGAVYSGEFVVNQLQHCTVSGNRADVGGGVYGYGAAKIQVDKSILWGNCSGTGTADMYLDASPALVTIICSAFDPLKVGGNGTPVIQGPQVNSNPLFCGPRECSAAPSIAGSYALSSSSPCLASVSPCDSLIGALGEGCSVISVPGELMQSPSAELIVYPSPSRGSVSIRFKAATGSRVDLEVVDILGRHVRTIGGGTVSGIASWDRRDETGHRVVSGIYYIRMQAANQVLTREIVLVR